MNKQITTEQQQSRLKELIAKGKEQGFLTYGEVNDHLPDDISDPEQIEDIIFGAFVCRTHMSWEPQATASLSICSHMQ